MSGDILPGYPISSPIMVAAGALPPADVLQDGTLGAVVTPSYSARARRGRSATLRETIGGALYTPGEARVALASALRRHTRSWEAAQTRVLVSLHADLDGEFPGAAALLEGVHRIAVELSLVLLDAEAQEVVLQEPVRLRQMVHAVRRVCQAPVFVKLPYPLAGSMPLLDAAAQAGTIAATLGGGIPAGHALLVGPATFPLMLDLVRRVARQAPLPVIGGGGVATAESARALLDAGAAAVQIGSAHLANPLVALEIMERLRG